MAVSDSSLLRPIKDEEQAKRGWKVEVNGVVIDEVSEARIFHEKMGISVGYGMRPAGYDGVGIIEPGRGGVVSVPFVIIDNEMLVGVVEESRDYQGGVVPNVPRGFLDPKETHIQALSRETGEEIGIDFNKERVYDITGDAKNPNSAFFETPDQGQGVRFYAVAFHPSELVQRNGRWTIDSSLLTAKSKVAERILKCYFMPWLQVMQLNDMFSVAGTGLLIAFTTKMSGKLVIKKAA